MSGKAPMTAAEVKAKMISLHHELGNFLFYLAMNNQSTPSESFSEDESAITYILQRLEAEVKRVRMAEDKVTVDDLVRKSLEAAGFQPDDPAPTDSK